MNFFKRGPDISDLYNFFYVIQQYNSYGVSISEAVKLYAKSIDDRPAMHSIASSLVRNMDQGCSFEDALSKHPTFFPPFILGMIHMGETSGQLGPSLKDIVFYLDQEMNMKKDVDAALWTPKVFCICIFLVFLLIVFFIIPRMGEILKEVDMSLPLVTQIVVYFANFMQSFWWLWIILGVLGYVFLNRLKVEDPIRYDAMKLKIPIFKTVYYLQMQYRLAKVFGLCSAAGVSEKKAVQYSAIAADNALMKETLNRTYLEMEHKGLSFENALHNGNELYHIVDKNFFIMINVGSRGTLGSVMLTEAERYEKELVRVAKQLGDKVGTMVIIPAMILLLFLMGSIEFAIFSTLTNTNFGG